MFNQEEKCDYFIYTFKFNDRRASSFTILKVDSNAANSIIIANVTHHVKIISNLSLGVFGGVWEEGVSSI